MNNKITFNPTISFDGVAMIVAAVSAAIWFGALSSTVKQHGDILTHQGQVMEMLSESQKVMAQNIAVLTTLVNERTKK